jgi:1-pyrroline-5-carboxylate dehydrogenase
VLPKESKSIPCPISGDAFMKIPNTGPQDAQPFIDSLKSVPKSGVHNPLKNPERCAPIKPCIGGSQLHVT